MIRPLRSLPSAAALLAALLPLLAGCGATKYPARPVTRVVQANTERDFWWALRSAVQKQDYLVGPAGANESARELTSAWKLDTAPFRGGPNAVERRSLRTRVVASYEKLAGTEIGDVDPEELGRTVIRAGLETYRVSIRVEREVNDSLRSMDPRYAKWKSGPDDEEAAGLILFHLRLALGGDEFRLQEDAERDRVLRNVGR